MTMLPSVIHAARGVLLSTNQQRYRLLTVLGHGGAGTVFEAMHINSGQRVAIKLLHPLAANDACHNRAQRNQSHSQQFARELSICAQAQHFNIVSLLDQGMTSSGQSFAVFTLLPGLTLKELLIQKGAFTAQESGEVMMQVLSALVSLHAKGIIHRDLKPQNIMVNRNGKNTHVTLFDFGIAAMLSCWPDTQSPDRITSPNNACLCSPAYCAPEQLRGESPSTKVDLYAWGLMLLECLTGQAAVSGHNVTEICQQQLCDIEIQIPVKLQNNGLAALLLRVLHKDPSLREGSTQKLYQDMLQIDWSEITSNLRGTAPSRLDVDCGGETQPCVWGIVRRVGFS